MIETTSRTKHDFRVGALCECRGGLCPAKLPATGWLAGPEGMIVARYTRECAERPITEYREVLGERWQFVQGIKVVNVFTDNAVLRHPWKGAFHVNEYEVNRAYGGPEESGWYYDTGRFIRCVGIVPEREQAMSLVASLTARYLPDARKGLYSPSSVLSAGDWPEVFIEDHPGRDFPRERPRYE